MSTPTWQCASCGCKALRCADCDSLVDATQQKWTSVAAFEASAGRNAEDYAALKARYERLLAAIWALANRMGGGAVHYHEKESYHMLQDIIIEAEEADRTKKERA
jgi:hypothetical protein